MDDLEIQIGEVGETIEGRRMLSGNNPLCHHTPAGLQPTATSLDIPCDNGPVDGRYLTLQSLTNERWDLCEVDIVRAGESYPLPEPAPEVGGNNPTDNKS